MDNKTTEVSETDSITLNDLVVMRNIIHIASRRGAFSAEEFSDIGSVYNKVDKFLKKNIKEESTEKSNTESSVESSSQKEKMEI